MRKITKILLGAAGAATIAGAGFAYAAPGMVQGDTTRAQAQEQAIQMFGRMDVNKDGKLDQADRDARQQQRFDQLDTNKDGVLSREEFAAGPGKMRGGPGDGPGGMRGPGDGPGPMAGPGGKGPGPMGAPGDCPGGKSQRMGKMGPGPMMQRADTNGDGAISQAEFVAAHLAMFDKADANKDGTVTAKERRDMRKEFRDEWRERRGAPAPAAE